MTNPCLNITLAVETQHSMHYCNVQRLILHTMPPLVIAIPGLISQSQDIRLGNF